MTAAVRFLTDTAVGSRVVPNAALLGRIAAVGFSAAVGVCFGWYPAHTVAALNPIDALCHE